MGMEYLTLTLSETLGCPRINGEQVHNVADSGVLAAGRRRSVDTRGGSPGSLDNLANDRETLYRQGVIRKLNRMGVAVRNVANFPPHSHSGIEETQENEDGGEWSSGDLERSAATTPSPSIADNMTTSAAPGSLLIIDYPAHRRWHRDALRGNLQINTGERFRRRPPLKILFVLLLISPELLRHRFLGAETSELEEYNFAVKAGNQQMPDADEGDDVVVVNAEDSVENQLSHILRVVSERFAS